MVSRLDLVLYGMSQGSFRQVPGAPFLTTPIPEAGAESVAVALRPGTSLTAPTRRGNTVKAISESDVRSRTEGNTSFLC